MKVLRIIYKTILAATLLVAGYLTVALLLTYIPVNNATKTENRDKSVYLSTNGVHLSLILPKSDLAPELLNGLQRAEEVSYISFGWGDRNFYLDTPNWSDLTFKNAFRALFLKSSTLMHVTRYTRVQPDWIEIKVNRDQLNKLNQYIFKTFYLDHQNNKVILPGEGYGYNDDFYEALGTYSCFKTSNSWVNTALKESNIKACLWTPFDFRLLSLHRE